MKKMKRERRLLSNIHPNPQNPRTHPPAQIQLLAEIFKRHGPDQDIVVDENGVIIKGHGRHIAATAAGLKDYPVTVRYDMSEADKLAMMIEDNQIALLAGWDNALLQVGLTTLKTAGYDHTLQIFPEAQLRGIGMAFGSDGAADPEIAPEPPETAVSITGDVWILGEHRLLCGDATSASDVAACLAGAKPHLMVTDSPYGVDYDPMWRNRVKRQDGSVVGAKATGVVHNDHRADWREAWALFEGDVIYAWHGGLQSAALQLSLESEGFQIRCQIIWNKQQFVIGRGDYHWKHECCAYAVKKGSRGHWNGDRKQSSVWDISAPSGWRQVTEGPDAHSNHSTQKPIECMRRPIENNSKVNDCVYEPFSGSGTTIIAAEITKRRCFAIELAPTYVDVAIVRWQTFTGKSARLESTNQSFDETKKDRLTRRRASSATPKAKSKAIS